MFIGIDDTDGPDGMCTTYLMTRIIEGRENLVSGYPRLVRLNPNIPYRTRGNGALSIRLGTGRSRMIVGYIGESPVETSVHERDTTIAGTEISNLWKLVDELSAKNENTNPGLVISNPDSDGEFYRKAVGGELPLEESLSRVKGRSAYYEARGTGRGAIGAFASISWPAERATYEVIAYSYPSADAIAKETMLEAASYADSFDFTFNSMDFKNSHASIFPNPKTPVIYGIRGTDPDKLLKLAKDVNERFGIDAERYFVFKTNQGTDDHIEEYRGSLEELVSYRIHGRISSKPHVIHGGHYFSEVTSNGKRIPIAAFEPTKEFRNLVSRLVPGDEVEVFGSYLEGTLNLEKIRILCVATAFARYPPVCSSCSSPMKTRGRFNYQCMKCGRSTDMPRYEIVRRELNSGFYEVPVCARRHLSAPLSLMEENIRP